MTKRTYNIDTERRECIEGGSMNLLQRLPQNSFEGFLEAKGTYENGSGEVRRLLSHECSLIYECKICRSLFRNLTDFISHKRSICCTSSDRQSPNNGTTDQHSVISAAKRIKSNRSSPIAIIDDLNGSNQELSQIFENIKSEHPQEHGAFKDGDENVRPDEYENASNQDKFTYQDVIKNEIEKFDFKSALHRNGNGNIDFQNEQKLANGEGKTPDKEDGEFLCNSCQIKFKTKEILELHNKKKHCTSPFVFQCPTCSLTFTQPNAVFRHLATEHKQPQRRKRTTRETTQTNPAKANEELENEHNTKEKDLNTKEEGLRIIAADLEPNTTDNTVIAVEPKKKQKRMSECYVCKKSYERGVVLTTHILNCRLKQKMQQIELAHNEKQMLPLNDKKAAQIKVKKKAIKEETDDTEMLNEMFANLGKQSFSPGLQTVSLDKLEMLQSDTSSASLPPADIDKFEPKSPVDAPILKKVSPEIDPGVKICSCRCKICNKSFNALSNLRRHISMFHYRARRFGCTICDYRAFRRYDIVNHLGFVHKMEGDREEMSAKYVSVHEVNYSKEDVDSDIVVITDEKEVDTLSKSSDQLMTYQRCAKRNKIHDSITSTKVSTGVMEIPKRKQLKKGRKRQFDSDGGGKDTTKSSQKRPIRNRIKTVNKDFVYDLSDLLNKKRDGSDSLSAKEDTELVIDLERTPPAPLISPTQKEAIKGAVQRLAKLLVGEGRAALATMPELPMERPQMRPRITSMHSGEMPLVSVIDASDIEAACMKSSFLSDSFLENIAKRNCDNFKIKSCIATQAPYNSALNSLLQKVDLSLHNNNNASKFAHVDNIEDFKLETDIVELADQNAIPLNPAAAIVEENFFIEPIATIPATSSPPPTPKKRNMLQQQQQQQQRNAKQRESLLRSALED